MSSMIIEYFYVVDNVKHLQSLISLADNKGWILLTTHSIFFGVLSYILNEILYHNVLSILDYIIISMSILFLIISFLIASVFIIYPRYANESGEFIEPLLFFKYSENFNFTAKYLDTIKFSSANENMDVHRELPEVSDYDKMIYFVAKQTVMLENVVSTKFKYVRISLYTTLVTFISILGTVTIILDLVPIKVVILILSFIPLIILFSNILKK